MPLAPGTAEANWKSHFDSFVLILVPSDNFAIILALNALKKQTSTTNYGTSLVCKLQ